MISIDDFVRISGVKESTIRKNKDKIPGLSYDKGVYNIIDGTRYPCDLHRYKIKDSSDRRYLLLKAISEYKYISHLDLGLYHPQFVEMLREQYPNIDVEPLTQQKSFEIDKDIEFDF